MKAVVLTGIQQMELREVPDPRIERDGDVLLRMGAVGVCGSDIHYYTRGRIGSQVVRYPYKVGHECAGTVEAVGRTVTRVKPGDRVAVDPAMPCGRCDQCLADRPHTCRRLGFLGTPGQADGCLCEQIVMPEGSCFPIRPTTTLERAAISEPLAIGLYAVRLGLPIKGKTIAILGAGPIGLSVLLCAMHERTGKIYVTDKIRNRLEAARGAGAAWTGNPDRQDVARGILQAEPLQLDVVFECCGQQEALDQAVDLLKPGGKLVLVGIPEEDRISFSIDLLRRKEIAILNVRRQNHCTRAALDLIENGNVTVDFMITHRFPLARTKEAFDLVAGYRDGVIKAMIGAEES
jgi:L-iditol 2-dehydrogenase